MRAFDNENSYELIAREKRRVTGNGGRVLIMLTQLGVHIYARRGALRSFPAVSCDLTWDCCLTTLAFRSSSLILALRLRPGSSTLPLAAGLVRALPLLTPRISQSSSTSSACASRESLSIAWLKSIINASPEGVAQRFRSSMSQ